MTADEVLEGLRALSLDYRPDLRRPDGGWIACCPTCWPLCADGPTLRITESRRGGYTTVSCKSPGCDRDSILLQLRLALKPINGEVVLLIAEESCAVARWALQEAERLRSENARLRAALELALEELEKPKAQAHSTSNLKRGPRPGPGSQSGTDDHNRVRETVGAAVAA